MSSLIPVVKTYAIFLIIGGIALGLSLLFGVSPCPVFHILGVPCPACGLTRAFSMVFMLDFAEAFAYHPLFFLIPALPWLMWGRISDRLRNRLAIALLIMFVGTWAARMILLFPDTPPMVFNESSLLAWLRRN